MIPNYYLNLSQDEITNELIMRDRNLMEMHQNNNFTSDDLSKVGYIAPNNTKRDILELCAIGICAYNHFRQCFTSKEFIGYVLENLDMYLENGNLPKMMQEYYIDVFSRGNVDYLNNFLLKYDDKSGNNKNNQKVLSYSTAAGRAFAKNDEDNAAYTNILLIPGIIALVALILLVAYLIFMSR